MTSVVVSEDVAEKQNFDDVIRSSQTIKENEREKERKKEEEKVFPPLPHSPVYRILILGAPGVGKTTLTRQMLTSEYLAANIEDAFQGQGNSPLDFSYRTTFKF